MKSASTIERPLRVAGRRVETVELRGETNKRPLVLLHEGLGSVGLWRDFPHALHAATGRRVIAFSRFGHGRSEPPPHPRTPAFFHEEALEVLPEVLEQLGAENPLLIGQSDGGSIALIHAGRHPVAGIALLAPHVIVEDITVAAIREARREFDDGALRERMARHHDNPDAAFNGWCDVWLDPEFRDWSLESDAEQVSCPVLLVQGEDDPYGTLDQLDRIEARVRGPVVRLVVAGGHSPHLEARDEVLAALVGWMGER
ncbi:MAG: alpha/beta hydrolase [Actinomycetota bacterium]|nr:alpha/beta hydrolase [Actinomycetota bacterium]